MRSESEGWVGGWVVGGWWVGGRASAWVSAWVSGMSDHNCVTFICD